MAYQGTSYSFNQRAQFTIPTRHGTNSAMLPVRTGTNYYGTSNNYNPFVVYTGIDTDILFYVVGDNRKAVNLLNKTFKARIVSRSDNITRVTKTLSIIDYNNSTLLLRLTKSDVDSLYAGLFDLTITYTDTQGNEFALTSNTAQFQINYVLEIKVSPGLELIESLVENNFVNVGNVGEKLKSTAQTLNSDGTNTAVAYVTNFSGKFYVEGTLELSPVERDWFEIQLDPENAENYWTFSNATGLETFTWDGMFMWVRFRYEADVGNTGTLDKALYRA